jgi:hypothetical protein
MAVEGMVYRDINVPLKEGDEDPTGGIMAAMHRSDDTQAEELEGSGEITLESVRKRMVSDARPATKTKTNDITLSGVKALLRGEERPEKKDIGQAAMHAAKETASAMLGHAAAAGNMLRNMIGQFGAGAEMMYKTVEQEITGMLTGKPQDLYSEEDMDKIMDTWTREYDLSGISPRAQEHKQAAEKVMEEFIKPFSEAKMAYMDQAVTPVPVVDMSGKVVGYSRPYPTILAAMGGAGIELGGSVTMAELGLAGLRAPFKAGKPVRLSKVSPGDVDVMGMPSMAKNLMEMEARARAKARHGPQAADMAEGMARAEQRAGVTGDYQGATGSPGDIWKAKERARKQGVQETPLPESEVVTEPTIIDAKSGTVEYAYDAPKRHDPVKARRVREQKADAARRTGSTLYTGGVYKTLGEGIKSFVKSRGLVSKLVKEMDRLGRADFQHYYNPLHLEARLIEQAVGEGVPYKTARIRVRKSLDKYSQDYALALARTGSGGVYTGGVYGELGKQIKRAGRTMTTRASGKAAVMIERMKSSGEQLKGRVLHSGRGKDVAGTKALEGMTEGTVAEYDPNVRGIDKMPEGKFDHVVQNYVLNTVEPQLRDVIMNEVAGQLAPGGKYHVSVRSLQDTSWKKMRRSGDGFISSKGTFQKFYSKQSLKTELSKYFNEVVIESGGAGSAGIKAIASEPIGKVRAFRGATPNEVKAILSGKKSGKWWTNKEKLADHSGDIARKKGGHKEHFVIEADLPANYNTLEGIPEGLTSDQIVKITNKKTGKVLDPKILGEKIGRQSTSGGLGRGLKRMWDGATQEQITNNASGESPASVEALNRLAQQQDMLFFRTDVRNPKQLEHLVPTVDRVDLRAGNNQIIFAKKIGDPRIIHIESGPNLNRARSTQILEGIQQRANKGSLSHAATVEFFSGGGYKRAAELMVDLLRKLRENQRVHKAHDAFYVEPRFERIGGNETAFHTKNVNSLSSSIMEDGVRRLIENCQKAGMNPRVLEEAVLLAEQPSKLKTRRNTPAGKLAQWMRKEFDNAQVLLERNGITVNFKERMQRTLTSRLNQLLKKEKKTVTDRAKISSYKKGLAKLEDFEFVSIPKSMWFEQLMENPKTEGKALRILTARQRRVLSISDMQKYLGKKTNAIDVMSSYYHKLGNDIALSKVFESALEEGLATLSPAEARSLRYRRLPAHEAPSFAKYYLHDTLRQYLQSEFIARTNPSVWGQLASTVKMMTFDSPWYLGYYNVHQAAMLRGWRSLANPAKGTIVGEWFKASKMIRESHPEVMLAKEFGLQSTPYPKQIENLVKDMHRANQGIFKRSFSMLKDMGEWTYKPLERFKGGKGIGRVPIISDFYSAAWDIAWNNFDFPVRMTSYNYLREMGYSPRDAAQTAARFHGDYAAVPRNMRVKLNKLLYTPTFKLAMAKLHAEILSSALKGEAAGPVGFKVGRGRALGAVGTVILTNLFFDQMMTKGFGFERKFFGRRYVKQVETDKGMEDLYVTFSSPQNFTFKYAERLAKMFERGFSPETAERVFSANKYEITPLLTILNDAVVKNEDATGNPIYNTYDDKATKWKKSSWYAAREINSHLKLLYPDKEGIASKKAMAQEMGSSLSFLIRTMANGYLTRTELERLNRHLENAERNYGKDLNNSIDTGELDREKIKELTDNYMKDMQETLGEMQ